MNEDEKIGYEKAMIECIEFVQNIKDEHNENHCFGDKTHDINYGTICDILRKFRGMRNCI